MDWFQPSGSEITQSLNILAGAYEKHLKTGQPPIFIRDNPRYHNVIRDYFDTQDQAISHKLWDHGREFHRIAKQSNASSLLYHFAFNFGDLFSALDTWIDYEKRLASSELQSPIDNAKEIVDRKIKQTLHYIRELLRPVRDDVNAIPVLKLGIGRWLDRYIKHYEESLARMKEAMPDYLSKIMNEFYPSRQELKRAIKAHDAGIRVEEAA